MRTDTIRVIASDTSWIEGDAIRQLEVTAALPGIRRAVGLPDLHPGKGIPIGAAFLSDGIIYPHLVGNDIGCGMGLWQTDLALHKFRLDKVVKKLTGFDDPWTGDAAPYLAAAGLPPEQDQDASSLGTIGGGNHFAEFQTVDRVFDDALFEGLGLREGRISLLVHSGSRGLGEAILRRHILKHKAAGLKTGSEAFELYRTAHDQAAQWAIVNRQVIARRFMDWLGATGSCCLDICHNSVTPYGDADQWLHRKGAAPADRGAVVIPGSRGAITYIVMPRPDPGDTALSSLAHGAGRRWKRTEAKGRLSHKFKVQDLEHTKLGGRVICEDKALMYEEAPEAYKDIESVIGDLTDAGLIDLVAAMKPLVTYKTRRT